MKVVAPVAKNILAPLETMASVTEINGAIRRKMRGSGIVRAGKGVALVISNENMNDIIRFIKSLENSGI